MSPQTDTQQQTQQQTDSIAQDEPRQRVRLEDMEISDADQRRAKERILLRMEEFSYKQRLAKLFACSGAFSDIRGQSESESIAKAFIKIELGESMGFTPAESMTGIDIIQGRVAVGANLRAARMQAAGYSWPRMSLTEEGCSIPLEFKGKPMMAPRLDQDGREVLGPDNKPIMDQVVVTFSKKDAERAGLLGKDNYKKNPRNMYFARAITNAQRWFAPAVLKSDLIASEEVEDLTGDPTPYTISESATHAAAATQEKTTNMADRLRRARGNKPEETANTASTAASSAAKPAEPAKDTPAQENTAAPDANKDDLF